MTGGWVRSSQPVQLALEKGTYPCPEPSQAIQWGTFQDVCIKP